MGAPQGAPGEGPAGSPTRQETTMSLKWIAQRLHMGSWTYASNLLNEQPQTHPQAQEE